MAKYLFSLLTILHIGSNLLLADPIKIGALLCLTGECAEVGQNALNGMELAAKEVNTSGGVLGRQIDVVVQDSREFSSAANSLSAFRDLTNDSSIKYIVGPTWSVGGLPIAPVVANSKEIIITSPSLGVATFNETADNIFNIWPHDDQATAALAKLAISKGWKTAVVFSNQGPWEMVQGQVFAKAFREFGGSVKLILEPLAQESNLKIEALKANQADPDVIFFSNYTQVHIAVRELERLGYKGAKLLILLDETRLGAANGALEGAIVAESPDPSSDFERRYINEFGNPPGIASDTGYDVLGMYVRAISVAKTTDTEKVKAVFRSLRYSGASGEIVFDKYGGIHRPPVFKIVRGSKKVNLERSPKIEAQK